MLIKKGNGIMIKYVLMLSVAGVLGLSGCNDDAEEPATDETVGEEVEEAADDTGDAIEEAGEDTEEAVDDATE
jgi:hypothetical protein